MNLFNEKIVDIIGFVLFWSMPLIIFVMNVTIFWQWWCYNIIILVSWC